MPELENTEPGENAAPGEILAEIWVYVGQELSAKLAIEHGEYIIGRDPNCHISIDADQISRHHARLTFNAFELVIEDLGSSNGVFIEGVQVQLPTRVRLDQEVQIGAARLYIRLRDEAAKQLSEALWDTDLGLGPVREQLEGRKYKVITTINRGGMGVILQARDLRIRRTVAMKVMKTSSQFSRENVLRFIDEAQLTGQLEHPNIVPVYELGIDEQGETFYSMKFVKGITLDDVIRGIRNGNQRMIDKYPLGTLLTIFQKVCDGVAYAHSKGVVHRDLKPENIMIGAFGEVLVMDWGLAKNITGGRRDAPRPEQEEAAVPSSRKIDDLRGFETMNGLIVGTPPYISPEQARGELEKVDGRSDIWVLGAILYTMLTLRPPVEGDSVNEVVEKIVNSRIAPPSSFNTPVKSARRSSKPSTPDEPTEVPEEAVVFSHCPGRRIPDGLSAVVMKALAVDVAERYQKVEDLQADVAAFQGGFAPKAERASPLKHAVLWAGRHQKEFFIFTFFFLLFNAAIVTFFIQLNTEKNRARANERRAIENGQLAAARLEELRGTAPTFFADAQQLMEDNRFPEALEKIEYAIQQVPNEGAYHNLRGDILQGMLRLDEAEDAYEEALRRNPQLKIAQTNLDLSKKILAALGKDEKDKKAVIAEFISELLRQDRKSAARSLESQYGLEKQRPTRYWRDSFEKRGIRHQPFELNPDNTINVDFSKADFSKGPPPEVRKLRDMAVSVLALDDTRISTINLLKGMKLESLSIGHTPVADLGPLAGMPLRVLNIESTLVKDLQPLSGLPLETLRLNNTRVDDLSPLAGLKLEQLSLAGCRAVVDLTPLRGMPLQTLVLSRTRVTDLKPLVQSPLRELNLEGCADLTDLKPLMDIMTLEGVLLPLHLKDIEFLRGHPAIKRLSYKKLTQPAEEFWKEYDAAKGAGAKPVPTNPPPTPAPPTAQPEKVPRN
ncbi:MAG: protein kinase [Chthoniobacteraceae bacterium]